MVTFVGDEPWAQIQKDVERKTRRPVVAVVAYLGSRAHEILKLRSGDSLVCDASEFNIRSGATSASAMRTYHRRGVHVYTVQGLHAKVISSSAFAWVGSANASDSSLDLYEASVRLAGTDVKAIHTWAKGKCTPEAELSSQDITGLCQIKVVRRGGGPTKRPKVLQVPDAPRQLILVEMDSAASPAVRKQAARELPTVRHDFRTRSDDDVSWIEWGADDDLFKVNDWVVRTYDATMTSHPSQVIRISKVGKQSIVWLQVARSRRDPYTDKFATKVTGWAEFENDGLLVLRKRSEIAAVLDCWRPGGLPIAMA